MGGDSPIALPAMGMLGRLKGAATLAKQIYDTGAAQSAEAMLSDAARCRARPAATSPASRRRLKPAPRIEDPAEWERVMRAELASATPRASPTSPPTARRCASAAS